MSSYSLPFFKTWLIFFLVSTVLATGVGMFVGAIAGAVLGFMGFDLEVPQDMRTFQITSGVGGFIVAMLVSFVTFRWAVTKFLLSEMERPGTDDEANIFGGPKY